MKSAVECSGRELGKQKKHSATRSRNYKRFRPSSGIALPQSEPREHARQASPGSGLASYRERKIIKLVKRFPEATSLRDRRNEQGHQYLTLNN